MREGTLHALLGPTNTGKTHRAVARMLEHDSGMLGFPLRLLAREVYDRVRQQRGDADVALITGEEKIVPRGARYLICTVEAMPLQREVDFLAVDEIQLATHPQRGHLFTDRLLHARGRRESWFLGSHSMNQVLRELLPTAHVDRYERLSTLRYAGAATLPQLPKRSALVAFSLAEVYTLADRVRARRGGAAVVAGALSPRTRNAQIALFQEGVVDYLVATDAIGMGLNLDLQHVAFASTRKFDGRDVRELDAAEASQIAGRAGRHLRDGSFGSLRPVTLAPELVHAVEQHAIAPVRRLAYRHSELAFTSAEALLESLQAPPPHPALQKAAMADDERALRLLLEHEPALRGLRGEALTLLWDVCKIPDYRQLLFESHVRFLGEVFAELRDGGGRIATRWIEERLRALGRVDGDAEHLTARLAETRLYRYLANRSDDESAWLDPRADFRTRTAQLEDELSEALHERLVERFVAREGRRTSGGHSAPRPKAAPTEAAPLERPRPDRHHPFAALAALRGRGAPNRAPEAPSDPLHALRSLRPEQLQLDPAARLLGAEGEELARLRRGSSPWRPQLALSLTHTLPPAAHHAALQLLDAALQTRLRGLLPTLWPDASDDPLRGARHALRSGLGVARRDALPDGVPWQPLGPLRQGTRYVALRERDAQRAWLLPLAETFFQLHAPRGTAPVRREALHAPGRAWEAFGWVATEAWLVPIGDAEQLLHWLSDGQSAAARRRLGELGVPAAELDAVLDDLQQDFACHHL